MTSKAQKLNILDPGMLHGVAHMLLFLLSVAGLLFFAQDAVAKLLVKWQQEEYSHGPLVLFVAVFIGWHRLAAVKPEVKGSWWGIGCLLVSAAFVTIGKIAAFDTPGFYGLLIGLIGLFWTFYGTKALLATWPAFAYLVFAIPPPLLVYFGISQQLQLMSSNIGVAILKVLSIPVYQEGNIIDLGITKLQVVEACDGLRYIFPLLSLSCFVAYFMKDAMWKRALLFFSTIPIAILLNGLRVSFIGVSVVNWGPEMAEGLFHDIQGWFVFAACLALLILMLVILLRVGKPGHLREEMFSLPPRAAVAGSPRLSGPAYISLVLCALFAFTLGQDLVETRKETPPYHMPFTAFPREINDWQGRTSNLDPAVVEKLRPTDYLTVDYASDAVLAPVNLYMAYYASQSPGRTIHAPMNCIAGTGWKVDHSTTRVIEAEGYLPLSVTRMRISREDTTQIVYFWFEQQGRQLFNQYTIRLYLLFDALTKNRSDGALIRLITPILDGETEQDADERIIKFLTESRSKIARHFPNQTPAPDTWIQDD